MMEEEDVDNLHNEKFFLDNFDEVIEEKISLVDKHSYAEARQRCPELINIESNPLHFLRCSDFNVWEAVHKVVTFWEIRKDIFGKNRAFLPLQDYSGEGALDANDLEVLKTGYLELLPNDSRGQPVIRLDVSKLKMEITRQESILRSAFLCYWLCSQQPAGQTLGYTEMVVHRPNLEDDESLRDTLEKIGEFLEVLPLGKKTVFVLRPSQHPEMTESTPEELYAWDRNSPLKIVGKSQFMMCMDPTEQSSEYDSFSDTKPSSTKNNSKADCEGLDFTHRRNGQVMEEEVLDDRSQELYKQYEELETGPVSDEKSIAAMRTMQEALERMDETDSGSYHKAIQRIPLLCRTETPPERFLHCDQYDGWSAAQRICQYWRLRFNVFGEKAMLPLDQTERGALTPADVGVLRSGYPTFLGYDARGRSVLLIDRSLIRNDASPESLARALFYIFQTATENAASQKAGCVCIFNGIQDAHTVAVNVAEVQILAELMRRAMPISTAHLNIIYPLWQSQGAMPRETSFLSTTMSGKAAVHVATTKDELLDQMKSIGIGCDIIPCYLGGSLTESDASFWHTVRCRSEWERAGIRSAFHHSGGHNVDITQGIPRIICDKMERNRLIAALDGIPQIDKADLQLALDLVPDLVARETPYARFLKMENFNAKAAARRLTNYWKIRRSLFGDRAFLPMTASGNGAISEQDIQSIKLDWMLNVNEADKDGRCMIFFNRLRADRIGIMRILRNRTWFYLCQAASENPVSQNVDGGVRLVLMHESTPIVGVAMKKGFQYLTNAFPLHVKDIRVLCVAKTMEDKAFFETLTPKIVVSTFGENLQDRTFVHTSYSEKELMQGLLRIGVRLPKPHSADGGHFCDEAKVVETWIEERKRQDDNAEVEFHSHHPNILQLLSTAFHRGSALKPHELVQFIEVQPGQLPTTYIHDANELVWDAIKLFVPLHEKDALLEVKDQIPQLLSTDSPVEHFVAAEWHNPWAAAKRLSLYWHRRKQIYGDKAFRAMAMNGDDDLVRKSCLFLLPDTKEGKPIVCIDTSQAATTTTTDGLLYAALYRGWVAAKNPVSRHEGCIILLVLTRSAETSMIVQVLNLFRHVLPIRVHQVHVVQCPYADESSSSQWTLDRSFLDSLESWFGDRTTIHPATTTWELKSILAVYYNIDARLLPASLGGTSSYDQGQSEPVHGGPQASLRGPTDGRIASLPSAHEKVSPVSRPPEAPEEPLSKDRDKRRRQQTAIRSRRKRRKDKAYVDSLQDHIPRLLASNESFTHDNARLEALLFAANHMVVFQDAAMYPRKMASIT